MVTFLNLQRFVFEIPFYIKHPIVYRIERRLSSGSILTIIHTRLKFQARLLETTTFPCTRQGGGEACRSLDRRESHPGGARFIRVRARNIDGDETKRTGAVCRRSFERESSACESLSAAFASKRRLPSTRRLSIASAPRVSQVSWRTTRRPRVVQAIGMPRTRGNSITSIFRTRFFPRNLIGCVYVCMYVSWRYIVGLEDRCVTLDTLGGGWIGVADRVGALGTMGIRYCFGSIVRLLSKRACFSDERVIGYCWGRRGDDLNCFSLFGGNGSYGVSVSWRYIVGSLLHRFSCSFA